MVPKRPHDAYDMKCKSKFFAGKYCHKGKEIRETESPQEHNAFHKEKSLERQRLWGIKVVRRPGYDLKTIRGLEEFHTQMEKTQPGNNNIYRGTSKSG